MPGVERAACQRAVWALAAVLEGQATPSPTRKGLESWSPQGRTWGSRLWPWPPLPLDTAPAGSTRSAGRNTLTLTLPPAPPGSAAQRPAVYLGQFRRSPTRLLFWAAHRIRPSRKKRAHHLPRMHSVISPHPHKPKQLQKQLHPRLQPRQSPSQQGGLMWETHLEAGRPLWGLYRWAAVVTYLRSHTLTDTRLLYLHKLTPLTLLLQQEALFGRKSRAAASNSPGPPSVAKDTSQIVWNIKKKWRIYLFTTVHHMFAQSCKRCMVPQWGDTESTQTKRFSLCFPTESKWIQIEGKKTDVPMARACVEW